jgi:transposase
MAAPLEVAQQRLPALGALPVAILDREQLLRAERCHRLAQVEGVGPLIATALVAAVGNAREIKSGRELSA